jgi:DNA-binding NtrC family response regulator
MLNPYLPWQAQGSHDGRPTAQAIKTSVASSNEAGAKTQGRPGPRMSMMASQANTAPERRPQLHVLIVDDDAPVRKACTEIASSMGFATQTADSIPSARTALSRGPIDLLLLDMKLPGGGGLVLLEEVRRQFPELIVIVMTAFATVNSAVEAMRIGAGDYLTKPFTLEELSNVLDRSAQRRIFDVESRALRDRLRTGEGMGKMVGRSPAMEKLYRILSKVAFSTHPVLILGESGTGKELVARSIHHNGPNASKPFVAVDCASLVPTLIESELFGHVKGAFTGADKAKSGLLVTANGGTVFLDEIGEMPLDLQARLLRALQEKEVRPVGATESVPINARILAATNCDLTAMVETGRFRKDLFFRLNVVNLRIPPLRERKADIPLLAAHVLDRLRRENGRAYTFSDDSLRLMMEYEWPGNVRELEHSIERACALSSGPVLHMSDFPTQVQDHRRHAQQAHEEKLRGDAAATTGSALTGNAQNQVLSIAELEKQAILNTIRQMKGDKLLAAKLLGIGKTTLYRKLKEYDLGDDESLA